MNKDTISQILNFSIGHFSVEKLFYVLLLILLCFIISKIILKILKRIINRFPLDPSIQIFIMTGLKVLLVFISTIIITEYLGVPTTSLVALLSVVSLAVSLSIQGLLSNVAGGLTILFTRPFVVGDYIELDSLSGRVVQTGLIYTQLLTPENKTVFLPNSQVCDGRIINYTNETIRRIEIFVGASYNASADDVKSAVRSHKHFSTIAEGSTARCPHPGLSGQLHSVCYPRLGAYRTLLGCLLHPDGRDQTFL